ncbi:MAG: hypothetical protein AAF708_05255 [Deinococcota bacterium]
MSYQCEQSWRAKAASRVAAAWLSATWLSVAWLSSARLLSDDLRRIVLRPIVLRVLICVLAASSWPAFAADIDVNLGFAGSLVSGAWNPLEVQLRDQPPARLLIEIDQGSLRDGPQWVRYDVGLAGGRGVSLHQDDIYVPARWQQLIWSVRTPDTVLASGSLDRRQLDIRPLHLVVARDIGAARAWFGRDERVVDVLASNLPERAAAYDGVESLVLLEANSRLSLASVAAAATAGVTVALVDPLDTSLGELDALAADELTPLGSGVIVRTSLGNWSRVRALLAPLATDELADALLVGLLETPPHVLDQRTVVLLAIAYSAAVLALIAWGGTPGLVSSVLLSLALSLAAWIYLRPDDNLLIRSRSVSVSRGGLAYVLERQRIVSFPEQHLELDQAAYALGRSTWEVNDGGISLTMPRWSQDALALKPRLEPAVLTWQAGALANHSGMTLSDVFVFNYGQQPDLTPQSSQAVRLEQDALIPDIYAALAAHLPAGSALARRGGTIYVALPAPDVPTL